MLPERNVCKVGMLPKSASGACDRATFGACFCTLASLTCVCRFLGLGKSRCMTGAISCAGRLRTDSLGILPGGCLDGTVHIVQPDLWHSWEAVVSCTALSRDFCSAYAMSRTPPTHHSKYQCRCANAPSKCNITMMGFLDATAKGALVHISVKACAQSVMNGRCHMCSPHAHHARGTCHHLLSVVPMRQAGAFRGWCQTLQH
jgi:hypothetical protein